MNGKIDLYIEKFLVLGKYMYLLSQILFYTQKSVYSSSLNSGILMQ
jgi:hypothetical protein